MFDLELRGEVLALACRRAGVAEHHGRGAHLLPMEVGTLFADALV